MGLRLWRGSMTHLAPAGSAFDTGPDPKNGDKRTSQRSAIRNVDALRVARLHGGFLPLSGASNSIFVVQASPISWVTVFTATSAIA
jgi:hypothetical protein